jgi:hypothetical protein
MEPVFRRESFDVIGTVGFGTDFNTRKDITQTASPGFAPDYDVFAIFKVSLKEGVRMASSPLLTFLKPFKFLPVCSLPSVLLFLPTLSPLIF